jgi:PIN domain nuclease of toxin-antitoxin system
MSAAARRAISRAPRVLISPVSCFEIAVLVRLHRVTLDRGVFEWIRDLFLDERVEAAPLSPSAAVAAGLLGERFAGDPIDRLLYASARELAVPLVTRDRVIRKFARDAGDVRTIW